MKTEDQMIEDITKHISDTRILISDFLDENKTSEEEAIKLYVQNFEDILRVWVERLKMIKSMEEKE